MKGKIEKRFVDVIETGTDTERIEVRVYGIKRAFRKNNDRQFHYAPHGNKMRITVEDSNEKTL